MRWNLILVFALVLSGPLPCRAEDPPASNADPADIGQPPEFGTETGPGPGFREGKKKDDEDGISLGTSLAALSYIVSAGAFAYGAYRGPGAFRQARDAYRSLLASPEAKQKFGEFAATLTRLDAQSSETLGELHLAHEQYADVFRKLDRHIAQAGGGDAPASLDEAQRNLDAHAQALLELGLLRTNARLLPQAKELVEAFSNNQPRDWEALGRWLNRKDVREHRLFNTAPGQAWLAEFQRRQGHYASQWWKERHSTVPLEKWAADPSQKDNWKKTYDALKKEESEAAEAFVGKLRATLARAAAFTDDPQLKKRLQEESREPIEEAAKLDFRLPASQRQPGEFLVTNGDWQLATDANGARGEARRACYLHFMLARKLAPFARARAFPARKLIWPTLTATALTAGGIKSAEGLWHFVLSPIRRSFQATPDADPK